MPDGCTRRKAAWRCASRRSPKRSEDIGECSCFRARLGRRWQARRDTAFEMPDALDFFHTRLQSEAARCCFLKFSCACPGKMPGRGPSCGRGEFVRAGRRENSPAFQRWVGRASARESRRDERTQPLAAVFSAVPAGLQPRRATGNSRKALAFNPNSEIAWPQQNAKSTKEGRKVRVEQEKIPPPCSFGKSLSFFAFFVFSRGPLRFSGSILVAAEVTRLIYLGPSRNDARRVRASLPRLLLLKKRLFAERRRRGLAAGLDVGEQIENFFLGENIHQSFRHG